MHFQDTGKLLAALEKIAVEQMIDIVVGQQNQTTMAKKEFPWVRQAQEQEGAYRFDGQFVVTRGVDHLLTKMEIHVIYFLIRSLAEKYDGLDYLQVFVHSETEQKLFFIDQINDVMKKEHPPEHNYCTLMLVDEY